MSIRKVSHPSYIIFGAERFCDYLIAVLKLLIVSVYFVQHDRNTLFDRCQRSVSFKIHILLEFTLLKKHKHKAFYFHRFSQRQRKQIFSQIFCTHFMIPQFAAAVTLRIKYFNEAKSAAVNNEFATAKINESQSLINWNVRRISISSNPVTTSPGPSK